VTLTEIVQAWLLDAERMHGGAPNAVAVTQEVFDLLMAEQGYEYPVVNGVAVLVAATEVPADSGLPSYPEMVEIAGPDRVCIYIGADPAASRFPVGLDPAMPVVFIPVPPANPAGPDALEMYNRLRWYGLGPADAVAGSCG
jgi:hypothetical protein